MKLSKRTEYGLRALVIVAGLAPGQFIQTKDLADQEKLPAKFLESVMLGLRKLGFLESKVGSGGGYRLAAVPRDILIADVISKLETAADDDGLPTAASPDMPAGQVGFLIIDQRLTAGLAKATDGLTLEELLELITEKRASGGEMYYI